MSWPPLREVRKIAVFRPNAVGDFMFCLPALHALAHAYPEAEIVYLGRQWHRDFLDGRPGPVGRVVVAPDMPGIGAPEAGHGTAEHHDFIEAMRAERFDIALQMYGGGQYANPLLKLFGARLAAGMRAAGAAPLERCIALGGAVNRRLQLLEVAALAGASVLPLDVRQLSVTDADRRGAAQLVAATPSRPLVLLQPGASDIRRQWPPARFGAIGDRLAALGAQVVVNGTQREAPLVGAVIGAMRFPAIDLSGKASLSALCGLLERAALVVSNDTGPLHLALALDRPCVGIYWFTNLVESAPLRQQRHRAALSTRTCCPVCGVENIALRCSHELSFVDDVTVEQVAALALDMWPKAC